MRELDLDGPVYADKLAGCWTGKNCGGTLGGPLEQIYGQDEPLDVRWYPELPPEGGLPNDDLEMQLVWLKALEEVGPALTERDLARYWLDHIGYNFDEYGLSKTNLRLGLLPPVSGWHANWFRDCMGCPIRSEIWACAAPGFPRIAARYAIADAVCDHAGGESVWGELFNVAVESAAFVVDDVEQLLAIGLSYVPAGTRTRAAIEAAMAARGAGLSWREARERVRAAAPHYNAQYSPINLGFQVIGWLYGHDFGDAICTAVSCGYDTDCTGATLGSYLGILAGAAALPEKWTAPLGDAIATNEPWGGLRHLSDGPNPAPTTVTQLVGRIRAVAKRVLGWHGVYVAGAALEVAEPDLFADDATLALARRPPTRVEFGGVDVGVAVDYGAAGPAVCPGERKRLVVSLTGRSADPVRVRVAVLAPAGWPVPEPTEVAVDPGRAVDVPIEVAVPGPAAVANANGLYVAVQPRGRPNPPAVPVVLVGARAVRVAGPYPLRGGDAAAELAVARDPEHAGSAELTDRGARPGQWRDAVAVGNALPAADLLAGPGIGYLRTFVEAPEPVAVWLGVDASCAAAAWLDGEQVISDARSRPIRPNYAGDAESYATVRLHRGWNELLVKLVRGPADPPVECHLLLSSADRLHDGQPLLGWTRFPWD